MSFLINMVGLLIIDMLYGESSETDSSKFFILFFATNIIGGLLYKYKYK